MSTAERIAHLDEEIRSAMASANVLFQRPEGDEVGTRPLIHRDTLTIYLKMLHAISDELKALPPDEEGALRFIEMVSELPDSIDYANELIDEARESDFAQILKACIWDAIRGRLPGSTADAEAARSPHLVHAVVHAAKLLKVGVSAPTAYMKLLEDLSAEKREGTVPRLDPAGLGVLEDDALDVAEGETSLSPELVQTLHERLKQQDIFAGSRTFRPHRDEIRPGPVGEIRPLESFYGYRQERRFMEEYFEGFDGQHPIQPLLLGGMPGVGKTHLTIAYALSAPDVALITADQSHLEGPLEGLIDTLASHHYRRFALFFDDIDPDEVDWATFRNQIDGYLPFADNVAIVIATNGSFPVSIRSRCRVFEFRSMNPEVCQEFVSDYLEAHRWMSQPYPNLVSTVSADYASMFKRGVYSELTPRSLIRYFETLERDKEKIKRLIRESLEDIVRVPSEDAFYESNQRIMNQLEEERGGGAAASSTCEQPVHTYFGKKNLLDAE